MQFCGDLWEKPSHLVNWSSTKPVLEVGIIIAYCGLKDKLSLGVRNLSLNAVGENRGLGALNSCVPVSLSSSGAAEGHLEHRSKQQDNIYSHIVLMPRTAGTNCHKLSA